MQRGRDLLFFGMLMALVYGRDLLIYMEKKLSFHFALHKNHYENKTEDVLGKTTKQTF